jgi:hypothetical protein
MHSSTRRVQNELSCVLCDTLCKQESGLAVFPCYAYAVRVRRDSLKNADGMYCPKAQFPAQNSARILNRQCNRSPEQVVSLTSVPVYEVFPSATSPLDQFIGLSWHARWSCPSALVAPRSCKLALVIRGSGFIQSFCFGLLQLAVSCIARTY